jgi:hypothetical protein
VTKTLTIIENDGTETAATLANNLHWQWPISGSLKRDEPATISRLMRNRPARYIGSKDEIPEIEITFGVIADDRATAETRLAALLWKMDPERGEFWLKIADDESGATRQIRLVRIGYTIDPRSLQHFTNLAVVTVRAQAPQLAWYDPTPVTVSGQFNGATPVAIDAVNANAESWVTLVYSGEVANPKVAFEGGYYMQLSGTVGAGEVLRGVFAPDAADFGWMLDGATPWTARKTVASRFAALPAGTTDMTFTAASGTAQITGTFTRWYKEPL